MANLWRLWNSIDVAVDINLIVNKECLTYPSLLDILQMAVINTSNVLSYVTSQTVKIAISTMAP